MRYALVFAALGLAAAGVVATAAAAGRWPLAALFAWITVSAWALTAGYAGLGARPFGKRADGSRAAWGYLLTGPYLLLAALIWRVMRLVRRGPAAHQLYPGMWIGCRPRARDLPAAVTHLVDLTAELGEEQAARAGRTYQCLPTLDGHVADDAAFAALIRELARHAGTVYLHCAEGRGRAGTAAVALLLARGEAADLEGALRLALARRPVLRPRGTQLAQVRRLFAGPAEG